MENDLGINKLVGFLDMYRKDGPLPILWVGAGASAAAGYPTLDEVEKHLRTRLGGSSNVSFALIDEFVEEFGKVSLANELQTLFGPPLPFVGLHESMARMLGAGLFAAIFTTNYDELIEDALKAQRTSYLAQTLELNFELHGRQELLVLKLHGGRTDWQNVILSGKSYAAFRASYALLHNQLDLNLRTHPLVFVGCSMRDPRLLVWLRKLPKAKRGALHPGRVLIREVDWNQIPDDDRSLLTSCNIRPIPVKSFDDIATVLAGVAARLVPSTH